MNGSRSILDGIASRPEAISEIGPSMFSALRVTDVPAPYDTRAALYDAVVGRAAYQSVLWGTSARSLGVFARNAVDASGGDWFAEAGCGSLLFTHSLHREATGPPTLLADLSVRMLQRGRNRLCRGGRALRSDVIFLRADVSALPIRSAVFGSILSLNLVHVPCDASAIARELSRLLKPSTGRLFVSCLVRSGRWSDGYLRFLHSVGELRAPWTLEALQRTLISGWGEVESTSVEGNMCYMVIRHAGHESS